MHGLVIRNGQIVDGSGAPARSGDIAIDGGVIAQVGGKAGAGRREIDAGGLLVAPGWVDIHTHYDGQVAWDPYLTPSSWHGVTTVIMGNCGVGFAPVQRGKEDFLIDLMEGVEDIPSATLEAGVDWRWETFPEYLDALSTMKRAIDVGTHVPHCAVRAYVMGERGAANEEATPEDIAKMASVVRDGLRAGALGFSTSRTVLHRTKSKAYVPGTFAAVDEVVGLGRMLGEAGHGVYEIVSDLTGPDADLQWMIKLTTETGRPISIAPIGPGKSGMGTRALLEFIKRHNAAGARIIHQMGVRPAGSLMSLQSSFHPFSTHPTYRKSLADLSLADRVARMREPAVRAQILSEQPTVKEKATLRMAIGFDNFFPLGDPPDYEPVRENSIAERAERSGKTPQELTYDMLLERDGREIIYMPLAYRHFGFDRLKDVLLDPAAVISLSDGGAHCGIICDASTPTYVIAYWVRDRKRGERIALETAVKLQTRDTAQLYGLTDRGRLAPGMKADVNLIDFDNLGLHAPEMVFDFPASGRRFIQRAEGYKYTIVSGEVILQDGEPTGALPGKVIRGGLI